jgi:hypothetical protein
VTFIWVIDNDDFDMLLRKHLILPYIHSNFLLSHLSEYAGGFLFALQKLAKPCSGKLLVGVPQVAVWSN